MFLSDADLADVGLVEAATVALGYAGQIRAFGVTGLDGGPSASRAPVGHQLLHWRSILGDTLGSCHHGHGSLGTACLLKHQENFAAQGPGP